MTLPNETMDINYDTRIRGREKRVEEARSLDLMSNVFLSVALMDKPACQYVLRILLQQPQLMVKEVRTQYRISKLHSHDAILDALAEDETGKLYNIEIQRRDTVDHARRTRFYSSMLDSEYLAKGTEYSDMPDVYVLYISETDLWNAGKTVYPLQKFYGGTDIPYDDGIHILYVNAKVNDGSEIAELMQYFKHTDPKNMRFGELSERIHFLKVEEGGYQDMCEVSDRWYQEGKMEGILEGKKEGILEGKKEEKQITVKRLFEMMPSLSLRQIAMLADVSLSDVQKWIQQTPPQQSEVN